MYASVTNMKALTCSYNYEFKRANNMGPHSAHAVVIDMNINQPPTEYDSVESAARVINGWWHVLILLNENIFFLFN